MLEFNALKIGYQQPIFDKSFDEVFYPGDFVILLGRNGAGKTTLLKTLSGDLMPCAGQIVINGKSMNTIKTRDRACLISMVTTTRCLTPYMKTEDLIALGRFPYLNFWGNLRAEDARVVDRTIDVLGISYLRGKYITDCSEGEHQLVQIARALVQDTPVILLDEATAHLDFVNRVKLFECLKQLALKEKKLILFASHELEMAMQFATRIILFKGDEVIIDTPANHSKNGTIQKVFATEGLTYKLNI